MIHMSVSSPLVSHSLDLHMRDLGVYLERTDPVGAHTKRVAVVRVSTVGQRKTNEPMPLNSVGSPTVASRPQVVTIW